MLVSFSIIFGVSIATDSAKTSHLSHVGGVFFGVLWALAAMPNGFSQAWKIIAAILGTVGLITSIACLFLYFYLNTFPAICCGVNCT